MFFIILEKPEVLRGILFLASSPVAVSSGAEAAFKEYPLSRPVSPTLIDIILRREEDEEILVGFAFSGADHGLQCIGFRS
jgi:hypothetical protein